MADDVTDASRRARHPCSHEFPTTTDDFAELARRDPRLETHLTTITRKKGSSHRAHIDFSDPAACLALAAAHMCVDFDLPHWSIPTENHLVPAIPSRLAYLRWVHDELLSPRESEDAGSASVFALDVGTGASCVYPLLGVRACPRWRFVATEVDDDALKIASENVSAHRLEHHIALLKPSDPSMCFPDQADLNSVTQGPPLQTHVPDSHPHTANIEFTVCNPPFYHSLADAGFHPKRARTGSAQQYVTSGGELRFIKRMISESALTTTRFRIRWFTSLVGRKVDLKPLVDELRAPAVAAAVVRTKTLHYGRTARWVLAWSFFPGGERGAAGTGPGCSLLGVRLPARASLRLNIADVGGAEMDCREVVKLLHAALAEDVSRVEEVRRPVVLLRISRTGGEYAGGFPSLEIVPSRARALGCFDLEVKLHEQVDGSQLTGHMQRLCTLVTAFANV